MKTHSRPQTENKWSLIPGNGDRMAHTRESKGAFVARLKKDGCCLSLNKCKEQHDDDCFAAFVRFRTAQYSTWMISDPRFDKARPCTAKEVYWHAINDPRSEFSLNYGDKESMTSQQMMEQYAATLDPGAKKEFKPKTKAEIEELPSTQRPAPIKTEVAIPDIIPKTEADVPDLEEWSSKKSAKMTEIIRWVFDNVARQDVNLGSAPSAGAVGLLKWAKSDRNRANFYTYFVTKLIPSQKELDHAAKLKDDGSNLFPLLEDLLKEV